VYSLGVSGAGEFLSKDTNYFSVKTTSYMGRYDDYSLTINKSESDLNLD